MNLDAQLKLQAWLDGELPAAEAREVAAWLNRDPEAQALYAELKHTHSLLAGNEPAYPLPVTSDFYWSQITRQIESSSETDQESTTALPNWARGWFRWLAPLGAVAMLALVLLPLWKSAPPPAMAAVSGIEIETEIPDTRVITFRSDLEGISVVWVDTQ